MSCEIKSLDKSELIDLLDRNSGEGNTPIRQAVKLLKDQELQLEALKKDAERLDWIWETAKKSVFRLKGIELFTCETQHIISTTGIRELLDKAMKIKERNQ